MSSSEIVDSGRLHAARSNFSQTCNLLSQYLKENGSFGDLALGFTPPTSNKVAPTETMNLLSTIEKSGSRSLNQPPPKTAPMTIFYAGQVIVFNDFPAEKAKEIMALASKSSPGQNHPAAGFTPPLPVRSPAESAASVSNIVQPSLASTQPRKNSLARFLEKRRDRITANAPYPAAAKAAPAPAKHVKAEAWLGLGPQIHRN